MRWYTTEIDPEVIMLPPVDIAVREILDYFGTCPRCGYAAEAVRTVRTFADRHRETEITATCGLPCGWYGAAPLTTMTGAHAGGLS
ncbi:hypothetical protein [Nocardia vermiculata]|uniref:Uncharacterized protein n=1 Tax=Nocardia vermiculata TaxID=257274 RepID=A0A846XW12_9NOCA|nr:hypothetical protein [Nocardia vermiculata]NKY50827.1 hypothetical protein [Nocardia vermiculata]